MYDHLDVDELNPRQKIEKALKERLDARNAKRRRPSLPPYTDQLSATELIDAGLKERERDSSEFQDSRL
jgi:hypothetical protein